MFLDGHVFASFSMKICNQEGLSAMAQKSSKETNLARVLAPLLAWVGFGKEEKRRIPKVKIIEISAGFEIYHLLKGKQTDR